MQIETPPLPYQIEKGLIVALDGKRGGREHRSMSRPFDFYARRQHISIEQYRAGDRFFKLWYYSILQARYATMRYGDDRGNFCLESHCIAPRDYMDASNYIRPKSRGLVFDVCCMDGKAGKLMVEFRDGLDDLISFFKARE